MRKVLLNIGRVLLIVVLLGVIYGLLYLKPLEASPRGLAAAQNGGSVTVSTTSDLISFKPSHPATTGFIFYPGALVDPRAYAPYMHTYAEHGIAAFIVKMPFDIAFLGINAAEDIIQQHPEIHNWFLGGHSLGGVAASTFVSTHVTQIKGLVLDASYPASDISSRITSVAVLSLSGSNDGLATPQKVQQYKAFLPAKTHYVVIQGGIHGYFGDYGQQSGDGLPTISRAVAEEQITTQTLNFILAISKSPAN